MHDVRSWFVNVVSVVERPGTERFCLAEFAVLKLALMIEIPVCRFGKTGVCTDNHNYVRAFC